MTFTISPFAWGFVLGWIVGALFIVLLGVWIYKAQKSKKSQGK